MTEYCNVTHPVKDFDAWKAIFDQFEPIRKEAGERSAVILRHANNPSMVTIINTWDSIDAPQEFLNREELKAGMAEAGVTAPPTIIFANEA